MYFAFTFVFVMFYLRPFACMLLKKENNFIFKEAKFETVIFQANLETLLDVNYDYIFSSK